MSGITQVPSDVLEQILLFVGVRDVVKKVSILNKAFRKLAHSERLWQHFCKQTFPRSNAEQFQIWANKIKGKDATWRHYYQYLQKTRGLNKKVLMKVILLGDSGVGKTSVMNKFVLNRFTQNYKATIGADFLTKDMQIDDQLVTLQLWDTAGPERFQSLGVAFYRGADAVVLVFSQNNRRSFESIPSWLDEMLRQISRDPLPTVMLGNKSDLISDTFPSVASAARIAELASSHGITYFPTSAKTGENVEAAFELLCHKVLAAKAEENDKLDYDVLGKYTDILLDDSNASAASMFGISSCRC